jgi:ADP-ribose pyrophosphatase YjhB (NUDIX family)
MEKSTRTAGGVVINTKGEILVVNQGGVHWSLPKGHIEPGEGAVEAARREIGEESGIDDLTLIKELGTYERYRMNWDGSDNLDEFKVIELFLFTTPQQMLKPRDPDNPSAQWVAKGKVADTLTHPKDKEFFKSIIDQLE